MQVLSFDLGTRTGYGIGPASGRPHLGAVVLKKPGVIDTWQGQFGGLFRDLIGGNRPGIVAWEVPFSPEAWLRQPNGRRQNGASVIMQNSLSDILISECDRYEIPWVKIARQTVLKHFTGRASHSSAPKAGDGSELGKKACLEMCARLGWLHAGCKDTERGDAAATWSWAAGVYGKHVPPELLMFDQGKMKHQDDDPWHGE